MYIYTHKLHVHVYPCKNCKIQLLLLLNKYFISSIHGKYSSSISYYISLDYKHLGAACMHVLHVQFNSKATLL